jgi:hypothetical protein
VRCSKSSVKTLIAADGRAITKANERNALQQADPDQQPLPE